MDKKYLPIGSIVLLKNANKKVMVTGFYVKAAGFDRVFDYSGCVYPEGELSSKETRVFNNDEIDKVIYKGYENEEEESFKGRLYNAINIVENIGNQIS